MYMYTCIIHVHLLHVHDYNVTMYTVLFAAGSLAGGICQTRVQTFNGELKCVHYNEHF